MSIFKKQEAVPSRATTTRAGLPGEGAISIIGPGMLVQGDVLTDGTVRIEGEVRGTIRAQKAVILGKEGSVEGDIYTGDAIIGGRVRGMITAENRLELQSTSQVTGEVHTRAECLRLEEGARFTGQVHILGESAPELVREQPVHLLVAGDTTASADSAEDSKSSPPGRKRSHDRAIG